MPSFEKISITISIGVWSVTVIGLRSTMLNRRTGEGSFWALTDGVGACKVKYTLELCDTLSLCERAFSEIEDAIRPKIEKY